MPDGDTITPNGDGAQGFSPRTGRKAIGRRLKVLRERYLRMDTQVQLARTMESFGAEGASPSAINRVELGERLPSLDLVLWMAHLTGVPAERIIGGVRGAGDRTAREAAAYREMRAVVLRLDGGAISGGVEPGTGVVGTGRGGGEAGGTGDQRGAG